MEMPDATKRSQAMSVEEALAQMQAAVRRAEMQQARDIGNSAAVPLGLTLAELNMAELIKIGAEGSVYRGTWHAQNVAVKKFKISTSDDLVRFRRELQLLSDVQHPNITQLLGGKAYPPEYALVFPLELQNLRDMIYESDWQPGWARILPIALQLASALAHLHGQEILHRDIKPANILMSSDGSIKLADFGLACHVVEASAPVADKQHVMSRGRPTGGFHKRSMVGTLEYMAPEVLQKQPHSKASDMYAFAITLNELASQSFPFSDCTKDNPEAHTVLEMGYGRQELAAAVAGESLRPFPPKSCPPGFVELLDACWHADPDQRPTFKQVLAALENIQADLSSWLQQGKAASGRMSIDAYAGSPPTHSELELAVEQWHSSQQRRVSEMSSVVSRTSSCLEALMNNSHFSPTVGTGSFATAGTRERMEDRHVLLQGFNGNDSCHLLAVFDGHRGADTAEYASRHLDSTLAACCGLYEAPSQALQATFLELDSGFKQHWDNSRALRIAARTGEDLNPGCTALVALLAGNSLYVACAGDSRAVLCRGGRAVRLNREHTAALDDERQRILAAGGTVQWRVDSWRVGSVGLQITRSLGDFDQKAHGVVAHPEVTEFCLGPEDTVLIMASDGLWEVMTDEEAVGLVADTVKHPDMAAKRLATEAMTRGSGDNITVLVAFLQPVATLESVFANGHEKHTATATFYGSRTSSGGTVLQAYARGGCADEMKDTY